MCTSPRCRDVEGNPKTTYFLYVMMATGFVVICIRVVVVEHGCFFMWVSLSNSSLEPRLRRNSMVTGECCSVNRQLETAM